MNIYIYLLAIIGFLFMLGFGVMLSIYYIEQFIIWIGLGKKDEE